MKIRSMERKYDLMHYLAIRLEDKVYNEQHNLNEEEVDLLYAIVDGLTGAFIMDRINGRCSLHDMLTWPIEKLEGLIDKKIEKLLIIKKKLIIYYQNQKEEV